MHKRFLKFSFFALLALLWCIFAACTGLAYWTPMRTLALSVPFTISPLEWAAFWSYTAFLFFAVASQFSMLSCGHTRIWFVVLISVAVFTITALTLEYTLFFNARSSEKSDTLGIIFGCGILGSVAGLLGSFLLAIIRRMRPHAPNQAMQRTAGRTAF